MCCFYLTDTSIFLRVLFTKASFSQPLILWINLHTYLPLGKGQLDEPHNHSPQIYSLACDDVSDSKTLQYI